MAATWTVRSLCLLFIFCLAVEGTRGRERVYYVAAVEDLWDYAPSGKNLLNDVDVADDEHASIFLERGPHRIGSVYKKAMFRQYTDATYSQQTPRPTWLGFLGPVLRAEVDDIIVVHLKNMATRNYSIHPHGVFYEKNMEGALYPDGTSGNLKQDDSVPPGGSYTYRWEVRPEFAPTDDDANCLTWVYHSHLDAPRDIASGLIGALLTCKKGILKEHSEEGSARNDVNQDVFLMFSIVDENLSWYLEDNIQRCTDASGVDLEDEDFVESNLMHAINGYMFGNLPGIELCQHRAVSWHLFGMGNEVDIHSAFFHGNTLLDRGHRTDVLSLFPATFATAEMVPTANGKWLLTCQVNDHLHAGMQAFYQVNSCGNEASAKLMSGIVRNYYVAAEKIQWNYAPLEKDLIKNVSLTDAGSPSEAFFGKDGGRIGGTYIKVIYKEYTDDTFQTEKLKKPEDLHLGILGPILRAEEGDTLKVTFFNRADRNYSIHPHGLHYEKRFQGSNYVDGVDKRGAHVAPGERFTYTWEVLEGPSSSDSPCIPYLYYSATAPVEDTNSGLVGPLLVCRKGTLEQDGTQGLDKEFFLMFSVMDENLSWYLDENMHKFGSSETNVDDEDFQESNKMHAVNGLMYGNLRGLDMCAGDKVTWYTFGLGTEVDIHGVYFEGNTFKKQGTTRDTLNLFPHSTATVEMQPNTPDTYEVSCRVTDHYSAGMKQQYRVTSCPGHQMNSSHPAPIKTVKYFIAAEEIEWDYSPSREWELEKHHSTSEDSPGNIFVEKGKNRIGSRYQKVVYKEYTDGSFTVEKKRNSNQEHLGILGPLIKSEVGEQIVVTFKNKARHPFSITAHGVKTSGPSLAVDPGKYGQKYRKNFTFGGELNVTDTLLSGYMTEEVWNVPESSGPGDSDPNCISYAYYSDTNFIKDMYSGLLGPLVICKPGTLKGEGTDRRRLDIEKEFALFFMVHDENQSHYLKENIKKYLGEDPDTFIQDEDFEESNKMHGINGKLYGNLHGLVMTQGQKINWYLLGMGNEVDMHTVHFHAETFTYKTDRVHRADVFDLFPGTFQTVEMVAGNPGTWLLHCHVTDHIHAGMETTFTINESEITSQAAAPEGTMRMLLISITFGLWAILVIH
ncbi:ferroxidase HEPHL1 isoform X2 [Corythoichthys intestinalis]|uniref:ferroxidase HEPHL1 isoform X2 n=1 Tax=Corythoichthys intestinalis TaxID=161448 RepID=UPI0025A5A83B|nr:ferroxidase HEPHL1 isoform X2 [Corythoichthys intestinalis]